LRAAITKIVGDSAAMLSALARIAKSLDSHGHDIADVRRKTIEILHHAAAAAPERDRNGADWWKDGHSDDVDADGE
jgi:hypothetical protein